MNDIFVKNNTRYDLTVPVAARVEGDGNKQVVLKKFEQMFRRRTVDPLTGNVLATGYTKLSSDEYARLEKDENFQKQIKRGVLEVFGADDVPPDAMSEADVIESLQGRIAELEAENARLKKEGKKAGADGKGNKE